MELPDWGYVPTLCVDWLLDAGTGCYRIFNHVDAAARGYSPVGFNPSVPDPVDDRGGRFDATSADRFAYLYGATSLEAAVHEVVLPASSALPGHGMTLSGSEVANRSWCHFTVDETLHLVDLTDANGLNPFKAPHDLTRSTKYSTTREWGRYIRSHVPAAQGFVWFSRPHGSLPAFVLFEDRLPTATVVGGGTFEFDTAAGRKILSSICAKASVALNWP